MTVCFTPYVRGASFDAWVLPHIGRPDQEEFEVDVCNANAVDLLLALGLEPASYGDVIAIDAFSNLVTAARVRHPVYLGLREDKAASEVVMAVPDPETERRAAKLSRLVDFSPGNRSRWKDAVPRLRSSMQ